jgi:hypothetical protein
MKSILIEQVVNGWLVRPFDPSPRCDWARSDIPNVFVFTRMEDLQEQLPEIMEHQEVTR